MSEVLAVAVAVAVLAALFRPMFGCKEGFFECIGYWLKPDILSWFQGEHLEDCWAEMKLFLWLGCGGLAGFAVQSLLSK